MQIVTKVWGQEKILVATELYTLKFMLVHPGCTTSWHYHLEKDETFVFPEACGLVVEILDVHGFKLDRDPALLTELADRRTYQGWEAGAQIRIEPGVPHRFYNPTEEVVGFFEVSTRDRAEDSYRLTQSGRLPHDALD